MTEYKADADLQDRALPPREPDMLLAQPEFIMQPSDDKFQLPEGIDYFKYWTTDIGKLSGGRIGATVIRATPAAEGHHCSPWHYHKWDLSMSVVLNGTAEFEFEGIGVVKFVRGTVIYQLPMNRHREIYISPDFEAIEINLPATVDTHILLPNDVTGGWDEAVVTFTA